MSASRALRRGLPLLALGAALLALPGTEAEWVDEYADLADLSLEFQGFSCVPSVGGTSSSEYPRADIIGVENLVDRTYLAERFLREAGTYRFEGGGNINTVPEDVEGSPYITPANPNDDLAFFDFDRDVSLGPGGWFLGKMDNPVPASAGDELAVYESDSNDGGQLINSGEGSPEPFCVYGSDSLGGPFSFIGLYNEKKDDDQIPGTSFDLDDYYARFSTPVGSAVPPVGYVLVLDSGGTDPFVDAAITVDDETPESLDELTFSDATKLGGFEINSRVWSVDGRLLQEDASSLTFLHAFGRSGTYEVCMDLEVQVEVDDETQVATGSDCMEVVVSNRAPEAAMEIEPENPGISEPFVLDASGSFDPEGFLRDTYFWDLGPDVKTITRTPSLTYRFDAKGIYEVSVTVMDQEGAKDKKTLFVATENDPPMALFEVRDFTQTRSNDITFDASDSFDPDGDRLSYRWDFGDGTIVDGPEHRVVQHAFDELGDYTVTLTVRDDFMGQDEATSAISILYEPPVADFQGPSSIVSLEEATFTDTSEAVDHPFAFRTWTLGEDAEPLADGDASVTAAFPQPGDYLITLRVVDENGGYGIKQRTLTVENRPPIADASRLELPTATRIPVTFLVDVEDLDGQVISWLWDFGDGTRSNDPQPRHAYANTGSYPLRLLITDNLGAQTTWTPSSGLLVVDNEAPSAQMTVFGDPDMPRKVRFQDASTDDVEIASQTWYFDDGINDPTVADATGPEVVHTFPDADGTYRVRLEVTDDRGVSWSLVRYVRPGALATGGDADGDGIQDGIDNCPDLANPSQADANSDGVGDACVDLTATQADDDGDGVPNGDDAFPLDPEEQSDADDDGVGDHADLDDDNDGIPDTEEALLGTDPLLADTDGDGVSDSLELAAGTDPLTAPAPEQKHEEPPLTAKTTGNLVWLWVLLGVFGVAGAAAGVLYWLRQRGPRIAWGGPAP